MEFKLTIWAQIELIMSISDPFGLTLTVWSLIEPSSPRALELTLRIWIQMDISRMISALSVYTLLHNSCCMR